MSFLFDIIIQEFDKRELAQTEVPNYIVDNLKYDIRPYQTESFQPYILCHNEDFEANQLNALMMLFLNLSEFGVVIVQIFWGLWLYPFGFLILKSGFIPKIIGIFLIIGCFSYLTITFTTLFLPNYEEIITTVLMLPLALGEFSIVFWLLIKGVKTQ